MFFFFTFRKTLYAKLRGGGEEYRASIAGESVKIDQDLAPGGHGRTEYRGSKWDVHNVGEQAITGGTRAKVVKVDGLKLHVVAE